MKRFAYYIFYKLPKFLRSFLSLIINKPILGYGVKVIGYTVFSKNVSIGDNSYLKEADYIRNTRIGKYCCIADGLVAGLNEHNYSSFSNYRFTGMNTVLYKEFANIAQFERCDDKLTTIGNDVWIGRNVIIKAGVNIGNGVVVGAGSVVTKDIPSYAIVAGVPAKIIKYRFTGEQIKYFENIKWWDWPTEKIHSEYMNLIKNCERNISQ